MHKIESATNADGGAPIPASACGGGMAARVAAHDWSRTPLGPMDVWPQSLRTAVGICLNSRFPMFVWWGTHLINIYNDAYIPVLGKRHPHAFGQPAREIWGDVWPVVGPQAEAVMQRGEATWNERVLLVMERQGYAEDTYFTWSYSPIPDDFGGIGGLFCACTEETQQVLAERHRDQLMAELEAERGRLAETFAQSPAFVAVLRGPEHVFEYANEKYLQLIGRRDVRGKSVEAALPEVKAQGFIDLLDRVYATGQPHVGAIVPVRLRRAGDGPLEERLVDFVFQPMRDADAGGAMSGVLVHGVDVTDRERSAEAVRQSEQRYRTLFSSIDEGFCLCEMIVDKAGRALDYRFLEVNPAFEALTGLRSAAGHTARELVPGLEEHWVQTYARAGMGGESIRFEQGSAAMNRWFTVYASPVEPKGCGKFTLVFSNITERKRAENELQESERRLQRQVAEFETLLNVIPVGIAVALDRDCRSIRTNTAFAAVLGLAVGQNASKTAPADERPTNFRCLSDDGVEILDAQLPMQVAAREGQAVHGVEFNIAHNDGRVVRLLEYAAPLFDEKGVPRGSVGAFVDITDQAATAERLRRSEEQFRVIANSIPQLAWMARPDGWIFWYNDRWYDYTGTTAEQMQGWGWTDVHDPAELQRMLVRWKAALATGEPFEDTFALRRRDGQMRWHLTRALPLRDADGRIVFWFGTNTDIHDAKLLQEQNERLLASERSARAEAERASDAKSEFLATLSHELRTPLTPVLLTVSLMQSNPRLPDDLREDIALIRRNVELESRLISDLLDLTRIERGKLQLDVQDVDLHLIVRSAIDICQREASAKLTVDLRAAHHTVRGDGTRLQQIFWNLINNAQKFTDAQDTITVRSSDGPDGRVRVEVIDTGAGIDAAVLPRLFNAFEQGEARAARQQAGLGLGLTISRRLAEAHGGTIVASSAGRGHGATFTVELPAFAMPRPEMPAAARSAPGGSAATRPLALLLVEDHEATLTVMSRLLRGVGHRVTGVSTVASATAAAGQQSFDVIICDLGLPDGSGLDVMRRLRDRYAGRAIALTGYGMESDVTASRDAGFAEHLTKPVDLTALQAAIDRVVSRLPS